MRYYVFGISIELRVAMTKTENNRKDLKMNNNDTKLSTIVGMLMASTSGSALVYSIYLVFAITI